MSENEKRIPIRFRSLMAGQIQAALKRGDSVSPCAPAGKPPCFLLGRMGCEGSKTVIPEGEGSPEYAEKGRLVCVFQGRYEPIEIIPKTETVPPPVIE